MRLVATVQDQPQYCTPSLEIIQLVQISLFMFVFHLAPANYDISLYQERFISVRCTYSCSHIIPSSIDTQPKPWTPLSIFIGRLVTCFLASYENRLYSSLIRRNDLLC